MERIPSRRRPTAIVAVALVALATVVSMAAAAAPRPQIVGYYPAWQWYDRGQLVGPQQIPYDKLTVLNYAFFYPLSTGEVVGTDPWADENLLLGQPDWQQGGYLPGTSIVDLAHEHQVEVLLSVGGWTLSDHFSAIAADPDLRHAFAASCADAIRTYGFDGIDVDWEWPGFAEHQGRPEDLENFPLLLQALRDELDALGTEHGRTYRLTAFLPASRERLAFIDVPAVAATLDLLNVQGYDFFGPWDPATNHNAPLFAPAQGDPEFNVAAAFDLYAVEHGVDPAKINVGLPFYGRSFAGGAGLFGPHAGADTALWPEDEGAPQYYNVLDGLASFDTFRDPDAAVPYAVRPDGSSFLSYDDEISIAAKVDWAVARGAAGVFIWEITGDYLADGTTPLLDVVVERLGHRPPPDDPSPTDLTAQPSTGRVDLSWVDRTSVEAGFEIERSTDGGVTFVRLARVPADVVTYVDSAVAPGSTYAYRVRAGRGPQRTDYTNVATATVPLPGECVEPPWESAAVYLAGDVVSHDGHRWQALWWTQGEEPGTGGEFGPWEDLGSC